MFRTLLDIRNRQRIENKDHKVGFLTTKTNWMMRRREMITLATCLTCIIHQNLDFFQNKPFSWKDDEKKMYRELLHLYQNTDSRYWWVSLLDTLILKHKAFPLNEPMHSHYLIKWTHPKNTRLCSKSDIRTFELPTIQKHRTIGTTML